MADIGEITLEMKKLQQMKKGIESRLCFLETSLAKAKQRTVVDVIVNDGINGAESSVDSDVVIKTESEVPVLDDMDLSNMLGENLEEELEKESMQLLLDEDFEDEGMEEIECLGEDDDDLPDMKFQVNESLVEGENVKHEVVDTGSVNLDDLVIAPGWRVKQSTSKKKSEQRFLYTSPCGKYFSTLVSVLKFMEKQGYDEEDLATMRSNLW